MSPVNIPLDTCSACPSNGEKMPTRKEGYCYHCDAETEILLTVPWQQNSCSRCGGADLERKTKSSPET